MTSIDNNNLDRIFYLADHTNTLRSSEEKLGTQITQQSYTQYI